MIIKNLGISDYAKTLILMQQWTQNRDKNTKDELWICEFKAIFTQGINSSNKHIIIDNNIPVIKTDRGGKITYHGIGQIVIYCLLNLKLLKVGIKDLVYLLEQAIINLLKNYNIRASRLDKMPGVYVDGAKIAALGLRVKHNKTYHGISLNIDLDLLPFSYINPCGYSNLPVCNMQDFSEKKLDKNIISNELCRHIKQLISKI